MSFRGRPQAGPGIHMHSYFGVCAALNITIALVDMDSGLAALRRSGMTGAI
jgi:hypothetical protein